MGKNGKNKGKGGKHVPGGIELKEALARTAKAVEGVERDSVSATGVGVSDFAILEVLHREGARPVNFLGEKVALTSGSVTTAIDRLQEKQLVVRKHDDADGRITNVHLTRKGQAIVTRHEKEHAATFDEMVNGLSKSERRKLRKALKRLRKAADAMLESA